MHLEVGNPCNGYLPEVETVDATRQLLASRSPMRCMFPGDFTHAIHLFKHPRWSSCGVDSNRWGRYQRENVGIETSGTVWFANTYEKELLNSIPCDCIAYTTIKTAEWNEEAARFMFGQLSRGWRPALEDLCRGGYLKPCDELSFLIGKDTFKLCPIHFW